MPTEVPVLCSAAVVLRRFEFRDADLVRSVAVDPMITQITTVPTSAAEDEVAAYIRRQWERLASGIGYSFAVADAATDEAVGQIGLWTRDLAQGRASIGYWVAPQFRRRGFATCGLQTISRWALSLDEIERVELYVEPWNEASWRAAEAAGFEREGLLRSWQRVGCVRRDMYMYSRIRNI
jgi:ribosomal-protein-alanine N-acetyltransferase